MNMYDDALAVQSACNLSGVVHSFDKIMTALNNQKLGTDDIRNHPVCRLFAEQIYHLTSGKDYSEAYKECKEKADTPEIW